MIESTIQRIYSEARSEIQDGYIMLYRADWKLSNRLIAKRGHTPSPYCHAGIVAKWRNRLFLLEMIQWTGGQAKALSQQVRDYPGKWDVWRVKEGIKYHPRNATKAAIDDIGKCYGRWALARLAITHLPIVNYFFPRKSDDGNQELPAHCSMAVSRWVRKGSVDLRPDLSDKFTEPGDLVHEKSPIEYVCTLI